MSTSETETAVGKAEPNPEWEAKAQALREETRRKAEQMSAEDGSPVIEPAATLTMLKRWTPDAEPANEHGQITFSRAMLESAEDALEHVIAERDHLRQRVSELTTLLDQQMGTPCEQIRHAEETDHLRSEVSRLTAQVEALREADYQHRVGIWMMQCFGADITNSLMERCFRFFEEAGELCQALGMDADKAHALVDYTWGRDKGEPSQEVGGVMVTLAALCYASGLDMAADGETELARINSPAIMDKIRAKHAAKVLRTPLSALPGHALNGGGNG